MAMNNKLANIEQINFDSFLQTLSDVLRSIDFRNHYTDEMNRILTSQTHDYYSIQTLADILNAMQDKPEHNDFMMLKKILLCIVSH